MTFRQNLFLLLISLLVFLVIAKIQTVPGYMDADYYFLGGRQLAIGEGFTEPVLWNYLDDPTGLPHPSHAYWMPLASILAALGMRMTGVPTFAMGKIGFLGLAIMIPWVTATLSFQITGNRHWAFGSGILAIASGFYLPYITTTDTFSISMVLGGFLFLTLPKLFDYKSWAVLVAGLISGMLHLSRVDGILWLPVLTIVVILVYYKTGPRKIIVNLFIFILGYLLIMAPWMIRNFSLFGSILSPGGSKTLWLTNYDQLYSYPPELITFTNWWASGVGDIVRTRSWAFGINLQRVLAEQGGIFLFPFIILGLWRLRSKLVVQVGMAVWLSTFALMTILFPFAGARGGLFHACAVFQPLFWAVIPLGLSTFTDWGARTRRWVPEQANKVFGISGMVFAVTLSILIFFQKVIGPDPVQILWERTAFHYQKVESELSRLGASDSDIVMVKNPPGYSSINQRDAIVIPDGGPQTLLLVATRFGVRYIVLEFDHSAGLEDLFQFPLQSPPGINFIGNIGETLLFEVLQ